MLRLHDTALGTTTPVVGEGGRLSLYVCGPTVYDVPHLGHGRTALVYDVLRRYLEWSGVGVTHVSNITDIDDKIIERSLAEGRSAAEVAAEYEAAYWDATDRLGMLRPHHAPRATEYVGQMIDLIAQLVDRGSAYPSGGDVYFATDSVADYGLLAQQPLAELRAGARVEAGAAKRQPTDFVLWKASRPGEPTWDSPWGPGRPGWHTECVAMSLDLLGENFDLHTGGLDLKFPHHENERAQAVALGRPFARHWMHHAFVEVAGEKMSKSLGNFTSLTDLLARTDRRAFRLLLLQSHYRSPMEVTPETTDRAQRTLRRIDDFARRFEAVFAGAGPPPSEQALEPFRAAMDDDLDTPAAMSHVSELIRRANAAADAGDAAEATSLASAVADVLDALGLPPDRPDPEAADASVLDMVAQLDDARARRDFETADTIRAELTSAGWVVENSAEGTRVRRKGPGDR
ncbi:MAG TPA: cysteine--tRNA ligase [Acidimicrobiales bacterium]|nr:cysteine--tRNA ligase [Acidimicrobiales bacterium]